MITNRKEIDWGSDKVTVTLAWAFILPLAVQVFLFLSFPLWERTWLGVLLFEYLP